MKNKTKIAWFKKNDLAFAQQVMMFVFFHESWCTRWHPERLLSKTRGVEKRDIKVGRDGTDRGKRARGSIRKTYDLNQCPLSSHIFGPVSHVSPCWKTSLAEQSSHAVQQLGNWK